MRTCAQFGPGQMQQHGFARNLEWGIASTSANPNPDLPDPTVSPAASRAAGKGAAAGTAAVPCVQQPDNSHQRQAVALMDRDPGLVEALPRPRPPWPRGAVWTMLCALRVVAPVVLVQVELVLTESDYTLKMWPFKFKAVYTVRAP